MVSRSLVLGYHGCDLNLAGRVISGETELKASQNAWDWLGNGTYFWEDSAARAFRWAEAESRRRGSRLETPSVLGAVIQLGNCLNLADVESLALVRNAYAAYQDLCAASGAAMPKNRGPELRARYLDCVVIETLHQLRRAEAKAPLDTVRGFFVEGREL